MFSFERRRIYACHIEFFGLANGSGDGRPGKAGFARVLTKKLLQIYSQKLEKRQENFLMSIL